MTQDTPSATRRTQTELVVTMQCVGCQEQWQLREGEVAPGDHPMCPHCFMPGIWRKAERRVVRK